MAGGVAAAFADRLADFADLPDGGAREGCVDSVGCGALHLGADPLNPARLINRQL
jgi:hypothetical protein